MTTSGERNALDPDLVPVHHRIRDLLGRFPEGRIPAASIKALREDVMRPLPGSHQPDRPIDGSSDFEARKQQRIAAHAARIEALRSAGTATGHDLELLTEQLRHTANGLGRVSQVDVSDLDLPPERLRTIALHLLQTGATGVEVLVGLHLMADVAEADDALPLRDLALLGRDFEYHALAALKRIPACAPHLFWLAFRVPRPGLDNVAESIGGLPDDDLQALVDALSIAEAAFLVHTLASLGRKPPRFIGNRRFASVLRNAAESTEALGAYPVSLVLIAQLWDDVRYGRSALLGFAPGEREATAEGFRSALASREALDAVEGTLVSHPHSADLIWLRAQLDRAARAERESFPPGIAIRVTVPLPSSGADARPHVLIDGVPVVEHLYDRGFADSPERLLQCGHGLRALPEPRDVRLAEGVCVEGCCGALRAVIRRDDASGRVHWEIRDTGKTKEAPVRYEFDAEAYDTEIERAATIFDWEWPARRAGRLLAERLTAEPELLSRWDCRLLWASSWSWERSTLRLSFNFPELPSTQHDTPWLQFGYADTVPDSVDADEGAPEAAVERIVAMLRATDPKTVSRVTGGSREHAQALGYPWPPPR